MGNSVDGSRKHLRLRWRAGLALAAIVCSAQAGSLQDAQKELFAARYKNAAGLYAAALEADQAEASAYCGWVRSLLNDHRSREAYAVAAEAIQKYPQTPGAQTAAGMAAFRRGEILEAGGYFRAALKLDSVYPGALSGLAAVERAVSRFKAARDLVLRAYRASPGDPELIVEHAGTLKGAEHIAALREALEILDPDSEEARRLHAHIADDLAIGERQLNRLTSPYIGSSIQLFTIMNGASAVRGVGLRAQLNRRQTVRLLLDTGASGISLSPAMAARAGLEPLGGLSVEGGGIGDGRIPLATRYLAAQLRIGGVAFADCPVTVFNGAQSAEYDGLIGADLFQAFLLTVDFPKLELSLAPRPDGPPAAFAEPMDAATQPGPGFHRLFRFRHLVALPTFTNGGRSTLFVVDSGTTRSLLDDSAGREFPAIAAARGAVTGIRGGVNRVSIADRVSLEFAGFRRDNLSLPAISFEKWCDSLGVAFGGILGISELGQLALTIDYREGAVRFERGK
jgi:tetratricopeptide (TPR) repeat protein